MTSRDRPVLKVPRDTIISNPVVSCTSSLIMLCVLALHMLLLCYPDEKVMEDVVGLYLLHKYHCYSSSWDRVLG